MITSYARLVQLRDNPRIESLSLTTHLTVDECENLAYEALDTADNGAETIDLTPRVYEHFLKPGGVSPQLPFVCSPTFHRFAHASNDTITERSEICKFNKETSCNFIILIARGFVIF